MENNIISIGIFFDGTGNNGVNATAYRKPLTNNESYHSNITNIYKLFRLFSGDEKLYIEGIGTVMGQEDSDFAMATCRNPEKLEGYSSDDKLNKGLSFIKKIVADKSRKYELYIYGFSRGAMLARHFCHELLKSEDSVQADITIRFLGVFDTVESCAFSDYSVTILPMVQRSLHLCAKDECRYFFPLTGFFEDSREMNDSKYETEHHIWKEIFVPGAHADVGGGYLESSESVYISPEIMNGKLFSYVENIRKTAAVKKGSSFWDYLLEHIKLGNGNVFPQAYIERDCVYSEMSKMYGRLMLEESNQNHKVFKTDFEESDFLINAENHPYLIKLYQKLTAYAENLSPEMKPDYSYENLVEYMHISANFGLFKGGIQSNSRINKELINNRLNVATQSDGQFSTNQSKLYSEIHHIENSEVDYAYGMNIPNNDNWSRTILLKESF
ncbi:DUF2235 domain-containing protein [Chryseobacterium sp. SSA4.19]|uniref:T6SS phospholipase effector Tle1-like catalytic domain-containing protein n=1 Tax=Chryseobacterium sp. SSA4.19 TaxID=2919915 RepID=UPI001F4D5A60|nr:DUF2235 domain-containing protein [Chryseobacterium sp. SSA4.19]MCJ8152266.1 DUF2235 domain-containing protein [Chryseobacterium sp. SSA4.19]